MLYSPEWMAKIRYQQMLKDAANERLIHSSCASTGQHEPLLDQLGDTLIQLGLWLKRHPRLLPHA